MARNFLIVLAATGVAYQVSANPMDTFGYTSRAIGMGGGSTASASSYDAAYYNPAGMGRLARPEFGADLLVWRPFLDVNGDASDANSTHALWEIGFATPIPLGKSLERRLFAGLNLAVPGMRLYTIREAPRAEPRYPMLEDRNRRLVFNMALAVRIHRTVTLGAGISLLPDVLGRVGVDFTKADQANFAMVDVDMHLSANAGVLVEPGYGLSLGLTWRGANRTHLSIPVRVNISDKIAPVYLEVLAWDYSTPHEIALGAAWRRGDFLVSGDVTYCFFRQFRQSSPTVYLFDTAGNVTKKSTVPDPRFKDSVAVRLGGEWSAGHGVSVRAGFGWVKSPVPAQEGEVNLLDGDRLTGSAGLGFDAESIGGPPISVDAHVAYSYVARNRDEKLVFLPSNPGYPSIAGGGSMVNAGTGVRVRF